MSPSYSDGGAREVEAAAQLRDYAKINYRKTFGLSPGFLKADLLVRSPDASWVFPEHIVSLSPQERTKLRRACHDVVVEILSHSDSWLALLRKLDIYVSNGARCVIAIDPSTRRVETRGEQPVSLQLDYDAM